MLRTQHGFCHGTATNYYGDACVPGIPVEKTLHILSLDYQSTLLFMTVGMMYTP